MKVLVRKRDPFQPEQKNYINHLAADAPGIMLETNQGTFIITEEDGDLLIRWSGKFTEADVKTNHIYFRRK